MRIIFRLFCCNLLFGTAIFRWDEMCLRKGLRELMRSVPPLKIVKCTFWPWFFLPLAFIIFGTKSLDALCPLVASPAFSVYPRRLSKKTCSASWCECRVFKSIYRTLAMPKPANLSRYRVSMDEPANATAVHAIWLINEEKSEKSIFHFELSQSPFACDASDVK